MEWSNWWLLQKPKRGSISETKCKRKNSQLIIEITRYFGVTLICQCALCPRETKCLLIYVYVYISIW